MWNGSSIDLTSGGKVLIGNGVIYGVPDGTLEVARGGTLKGEGTIHGNVTLSSGTISPGHSPGTINIDGDLSLDSSSTVMLEVAGPNQYDMINVQGTINWDDAQLDLVFINGYTPAEGTPLDLAAFTGMDGIDGSFGSINVQGLSPDLAADVNLDQLSSGHVSVLVHAAPEPTEVCLIAIGSIALT